MEKLAQALYAQNEQERTLFYFPMTTLSFIISSLVLHY